jgi:oligoribonuclease (3'-5' exoribonuclease)
MGYCYDLETTGLDTDSCDIIEGCVVNYNYDYAIINKIINTKC